MNATIYLSYGIEIKCQLEDEELDKIENAKSSSVNLYIEIDLGNGRDALAVSANDIIAVKYG